MGASQGGEMRAAMQASKSSKQTGGLLLAPDVASYQCLREGPAGETAKKDLRKYTFKAGMCMKTNKTTTKCPKRNGHFRLADTNFAEICGEFATNRRYLRGGG
jgi:hypothetical protein